MYSMEFWIDIKNYEGLYAFSTLGNVKSLRSWQTLKPRDNGKGYGIVALQYKGVRQEFKIHRLVATHFLDNKLNKPQVNHINGIKNDNRLVNLEWCTQSENSKHSFELGLQPRKLTNEQVKEIRKNKNNLYQYELADIYGVSKQMIGLIINNKRRI